jgi:hypothetical protein
MIDRGCRVERVSVIGDYLGRVAQMVSYWLLIAIAGAAGSDLKHLTFTASREATDATNESSSEAGENIDSLRNDRRSLRSQEESKKERVGIKKVVEVIRLRKRLRRTSECRVEKADCFGRTEQMHHVRRHSSLSL